MKKPVEKIVLEVEDWDLEDLRRLQAEIEDLVSLKSEQWLNSLI